MTKPLVTMAMFKAQWNDRRDFVDNFKPFVVEHLVRWPPAEAVNAGKVRDLLRDSVALDLPIGVVELVLTRLTRDGLTSRSKRKLWVVPEKLDDEPDLSADRERARNEMDALAERVAAHAWDHHELPDWTADDAMAAIEQFLDSLGADFLYQHRRGAIQGPGKNQHSTAIVQSYARHASVHDHRGVDLLAQAVYGGLLAAVLRYNRPEDSSKRLDNLTVYLDTAVVLHLLGICLPQLGEAAHELCGLLADQHVTVRMFRHNYIEVCHILDSTATNLQSSRSKATYTTSHLGRTSREVLDHFIAAGKTPADVEIVKAELDERLQRAGIEVVDTPQHQRHLTLNEKKLAEKLDDAIGYQNESTRDKDVDSLTAIHRLRDGKAAPDLAKCPALFVTTNTALVRAGRQFFRGERLNGGVPQIYADIELTTQLWIRTPGQHPDLPRKLLIADSFAALNPGQRFWDKYLKVVAALKEEGRINDTQITAFLFSTSARMALLDATFGDAEELTEETLLDALHDVETALARPHVQAADERVAEGARITAESAAQVSNLESKVDDLTASFAALRKEKDDEIKRIKAAHEEQRAHDKARNRRVISAVVALPLLVGVIALFAISAVEQWVATVGGTVLIAVSAALLTWGWPRKGVGFWAQFLIIGGAFGVPATIWQTTERDDKSGTTRAPAVSTAAKATPPVRTLAKTPGSTTPKPIPAAITTP